MALRKNTTLINAQADMLGGSFNGGTVKIYTGAQPASANDAASGTLLCTIPIPSPAFGAASAGAVSKAGTWSASSVAAGTAGYARIASFDDGKLLDVTVGTVGTDMIINNSSITIGGVVTVTALTITTPAS